MAQEFAAESKESIATTGFTSGQNINLEWDGKAMAARGRQAKWQAVQIGFGVPVALAILVAVGGWVRAGFRREAAD